MRYTCKQMRSVSARFEHLLHMGLISLKYGFNVQYPNLAVTARACNF